MQKTPEQIAEKALAHHKKMTETPVVKLILTLGLPTTLSMLVTNIYNMADTYFVGSLGESAQGAIGIVFTLQAVIQAVAFMLGHGSGTFVAKELAGGDANKAGEYVSTALAVGGIVGLVFTAVGLPLLSPIMRALGSTSTILPYARDYGLWILLACPFIVCSIVLNNNLRYEGKALYAMIGLTSGAALNIGLDYALVIGADMGVYGAGLATAVSQAAGFFLLLFFYLKMAQSPLSVRRVSRKFGTYAAILRVGTPSLLRQGLNAASGGVLNHLTRPYGDSALAAVSIVNRYTALVTSVGLGIGQGFQPLASYNYSAQKYDRVKKGLFATMGMGFAVLIVCSVLGLTCARPIVRLFQKEPAVVDIGARALKYASLGLPFFCLSMPVNMLYQSIRNAGIASLLSMLRSGIVLIPVSFAFSALFGLSGIIAAQPAADVIAALLSIPFIVRFVRKNA